MPAPAVEAVTFDFFNTLAYHRAGRGRGFYVMEYLNRHGLEPAGWEHQVLYDVFEPYGREYSPDLPAHEKRSSLHRLVSRLFQRLGIRHDDAVVAEHAAPLWEILGPSAFELFPETMSVLLALQDAGIRTAIVSNWQCGLAHFCHEMGVLDAVDHVVASAEVGSAKPDVAIFAEACRRLGTQPDRALHVGDTPVDDVDGASNAGMRAVLLHRSEDRSAERQPAVRNLLEVLPMAGI